MATSPQAEMELPLPAAMLDQLSDASSWSIVLPVIIALTGAGLLFLVRKPSGRSFGFALLAVLAILALEVGLFRQVLHAGPAVVILGYWFAPFGISFMVDLMGAGFALVAAFITLVVLIYSRSEIVSHESRSVFYPLVLLLLAGVTGSLLTGDMLNLYLWLELTLFATICLMTMGAKTSRAGAIRRFGILNGLASLFFLAGIACLYSLAGTWNMADIIRATPDIPELPLSIVAVLFLLALGTRAIVFPVAAQVSGRPVFASVLALLGTFLSMAGIYGLFRTHVVLFPVSGKLFDPVLTSLGVLMMIGGPLGALVQTRLRRAAGYLVIGTGGIVMAGMSMPGLHGVAGAMFAVIYMALAMAAFYLVSGIIEKAGQTEDIRHMGGFYRRNALLSVLFLVLVLAVAGVPPFLGFWPRMLITHAALSRPEWTQTIALSLNSLLTLVAAIRLWTLVSWQSAPEHARSGKAKGQAQWIFLGKNRASVGAVIVLTGLVVALGLWPDLLIDSVHIAATELQNPQIYVEAADPKNVESFVADPL